MMPDNQYIEVLLLTLIWCISVDALQPDSDRKIELNPLCHAPYPKSRSIKTQRTTNVSPPNIIIIVIDDLGWDDISLHGSQQILTPNIDQIAKEGVLLENYYTQAICTPSRGALMTGMYPIHLGLQHDVIAGAQPWGLPAEFKIMPQYLEGAGYESHIVGKWHLGHSRSELLPTQRGFKTHFGFRLGHSDYYNHWGSESSLVSGELYKGLDLWTNQLPEQRFHGKYANDIFTKRAINILEAVHVANSEAPLQAPLAFIDKYNAKILDEKRRHYAAMVSAMDSSVGDLMKAVKDNGYAQNTILFFTNDNGGPTNGMANSGSSNHPLRGSKYTLWEGGVRGIGIVWAPGLLNKGKYTKLVHISDILPTVLQAIGQPIPLEFDGISFWDQLRTATGDHRTELLHNVDTVWGTSAYRLGDFKLISGIWDGGRYDGWYPTVEATSFKRTVKCAGNGTYCNGANRPCLYNLREDPCEQNDVFDEHPDIVKAITTKIRCYAKTMRPIENRPNTNAADPANFNFIWMPWEDYTMLDSIR
ncbi:arylsulfatase B-like isoform X2 [Varroa jacobsoni]|uniref:arylsulfatase B-like isoform X2 n=1 Tax=Varroa jacobsoni TaxID=62625 RepID=UPI000BF86DE0|nr:arylsulfatase B-like isoform X2 [Varroa jacobsoni]